MYLININNLPNAVGEVPYIHSATAPSAVPSAPKSPHINKIPVKIIFENEGVILIKSINDGKVYALPIGSKSYLEELHDDNVEVYQWLVKLGLKTENITVDHLYAVGKMLELFENEKNKDQT